MIRYHYFRGLYHCRFIKWYRFVLCLFVFLLSEKTLGQSVAQTDKLRPNFVISIQSGAQIHSSDENFNRQSAQVGLETKKVSDSKVRDYEIILIISAQSVKVDNHSKAASVSSHRKLKKIAKNFAVVNILAITHSNAKKYTFKNRSSHSHTISRSAPGRVFVNSSSLDQHHADAAVNQSVTCIQRFLKDLHCSCNFKYSSKANCNGFYFSHSVRPPPVI